MNGRHAAILLGVIALALLALGCGSSSDSSEGGSLTKAEFLKQGNKVCEERNKEFTDEYDAFVKSLGLKKGEYPDDAQSHEAAEDIYLPSVEKRIEELRALEPPSAGEAQVDALLTSWEDGIDEANEDIDVLFVGNDPFDKPQEMSKAYGLTACSEL